MGYPRKMWNISRRLSVKLNLGGRDKPIPGFKTVDLYEGEGVDIRADIGSLAGIEDKSVEEIYASHCLEHFSHARTMDVLKNWHRVLKPGAKAYIAVPDFQAAVELYNKFGLNDFIRNLLWGDQGYDLAYHYNAFDWPFLAKYIIDAGFTDVRRIGDMPHGIKDCSALRNTATFEPVSLNVEATA